jgi:hypothetical protein
MALFAVLYAVMMLTERLRRARHAGADLAMYWKNAVLWCVDSSLLA